MFTSFWIKHGENITSIAKGAALAATGAGATFALEQLAAVDFGEYTGFVAAGLAVVANALRKFGIPVITKLIKTA